MSTVSEGMSLASPLNVNTIMIVISTSIAFYDYILTFAVELDRFWLRPTRTWATFLFFVNRYLLVLGRIPLMIVSASVRPLYGILRNPASVCHNVQRYDEITMMLSQGVGGVLMIMRVYALYNQNRRLLYALLLIAMALIAEACWGILSTAPVTLPPTSMPAIGCTDPLSPQQEVRLAGSWSGQLAFDSLIFCLTLWKTWRIGSVGGRPLIIILLRDGAMYFAVMAAANLANILTFLLPPLDNRGSAARFTNVISATMISRMMLNLRDPRLVNNTRSGFKDNSLPPVTSVFSMEAPLSEIESYLLSTRYSTRTSEVAGNIGTMDDISEIPRLCRH